MTLTSAAARRAAGAVALGVALGVVIAAGVSPGLTCAKKRAGLPKVWPPAEATS